MPAPIASSSEIASFVLAAGALGTAAYGVVEASKYFAAIGEAGYPSLTGVLGGLMGPLRTAYGANADALLRAQYRGDQRALTRLLRQGVRIGLCGDNAQSVARDLASVDPESLARAIRVATGEDERATAQLQRDAGGEESEGGSGNASAARDGSTQLTDAQRSIIARYELAADARIDAAITLAQARYAGALRLLASAAAVAIALIVASVATPRTTNDYALAVLIGVGAVPLAPIAKDLASGIQAAARALKARA
ncbi:MAG: hypothetical protein IT356_12380 [Gemmatimonadaceae bacterium]|nr:hypothetical protein [Gemmatimonadaceae bacterium]